MSEKGQKIFKIIVWIVVFALLIVNVLKLGVTVKETSDLLTAGPITRNEWMQQLSEGFGSSEMINNVQDGENLATAEYAAITAMDAIGKERLSHFLDGKINDKSKLELAIQHAIVKKNQLDKKISSNRANEIIVGALDLYCNPDYYPEYCEVETARDVINADRWQSIKYNEEAQIVTAKIDGDIPETGEAIMFTNEYGIAQAKYVAQVNANNSGEYDIQVNDIENITDIMSGISFSGTSDFDYLLGKENPRDLEQGKNSNKEEVAFSNPFATTVYAAENDSILLAEWEWFEDKTALHKDKDSNDTKKCDIEFNVELTDTVKNDKETCKVTSYIAVTSDGITKKYKFEIDDKGKESFKVDVSSKDGLSFSFSENDKKEKSNDTSYFKDEMGVKANIKMKGFGVSTSGYYQWSDPNDKKNYVEVLASANQINISSAAKLSFEDKYKIGSIPIPIAATAGVISINLNVYLVVGANGELTLWYEIDDPYVGMNVSTAKGFTPLRGSSNEDVGVRAKIEINGGFIGEASVMVLDTWDLADPRVDVRAYAYASTIDVKDTYKLKDEYVGTTCVELKAQAPVIKLSASAGKDSVLYSILDTLKVEATYDLIPKDSDNRALRKLTYHVETESDGTQNIIRLENYKKHEDVCTHITKKSKLELETEGIKQEIESDVNQKVDDAKEEAQRRIKKMIEDAIEKWLEESCVGC